MLTLTHYLESCTLYDFRVVNYNPRAFRYKIVRMSKCTYNIENLFQISQLTPCQGCPPLEAPLHGLVTVSSLDSITNATYG